MSCLDRLEGLRASTVQGGRRRSERCQRSPGSRARQAGKQVVGRASRARCRGKHCVFRQLRARVGCLDRLEELRVSTIQGGRHRIEGARSRIVTG